MGPHSMICRLCLKVCESDFEPIEGATLDMLNFLLMDLDLAISDKPITCGSCMDSLKKCFDFKKSCLNIKRTAVSTGDEDDTLNIAKMCLNEEADIARLHLEDPVVLSDEDDIPNISSVYPSEEKNLINKIDISTASDTCCVCMKSITCEPCVLRKSENIEATVTLEKYFPELGLSITDDSTMCTSCCKSLQHCFAFINNCLNVEEKIKNYCKAEGTDSEGQIELSSVLHFTSKNVLQHKSNCKTLNADEERHEQTEGENSSAEIKNEHVIEVEEQDLDDEEDDIKIHVGLDECERLQDNILLLQNLKEEISVTGKEVSEIATFKCHLCVYQAKRKGALRKHMRTHQSELETPVYKCQICALQTRYKASLQQHMRTHMTTSEVPVYKCDMCTFTTKHSKSLSRHFLNHKSISKVTMHKCDYCAYDTKHKDDLLKHMRSHKSASEVTIYKCQNCPLQTRHKRSLQLHMVTHRNASEVIMHKCKLCSFKTKHIQNLSRHMLIHKSLSELKTYDCEKCGHQSKRKSNLQAHMLTHISQAVKQR